MKIALLTGGTGGVKLLLGLCKVLDPHNLKIIVNTGDNFTWNGLYIAPDVDTVVYALAGMLDLSKMWGVCGDTFHFLVQAEILGLESTWFRIGDKDLAMHVLRTHLMKRGYTLSQVTRYVCERLRVLAEVIPMTDAHVETHVLTEIGDLHIQEFLVKYSRSLTPLGITIRGVEEAEATREAINAIKSSDAVVLGPSSPPVSILPILSTRPIGDLLRRLDGPKIAISPLIGSRPVSGVTDKLLRALGYRGDVTGVAELYSKYGVTHMVVHKDEKEDNIELIRGLGMEVIKENIVMESLDQAAKLAERVLKLALSGS